MCLISFAYRKHPRYRLVLVANRDEFFHRPTRVAHQWEDHPGIYGGRDLQEGGTWLGLAKGEKFAAVTNYRDGRNKASGKRSRGYLTLDFLRAGQPAEKFIRELTPAAGDYAGFNLLCGDSDGLYYFSNAGGGYRELQAGIFGLSNAHLDTPWPKVRLAKQRLETLLAQTEIDPQTAMSILHDPHTAADEALPDTGISLEWERQLSAQFIRIDGYGTRCTSVLLQENSGRTVFFEQEFNQQGPGGQRLKVFSPKACPDLQK